MFPDISGRILEHADGDRRQADKPALPRAPLCLSVGSVGAMTERLQFHGQSSAVIGCHADGRNPVAQRRKKFLLGGNEEIVSLQKRARSVRWK
jgi:hypothetical protein